jgi:hypothetical protein
MKKARHPKMKFLIGDALGHMTDNGWRNEHWDVFWKKTSAEARANLKLQSQRHIKGQATPGIYIKVIYGRHLDAFGKMVEFYNDGIYDTKQDIREAFAAFTEKSLIDYIFEEAA